MLMHYYQKVKSLYEANKQDLCIATIIFLVGMASFGLGRLSVLWPKKEPITIEWINAEGQKTKEASVFVTEQKDSLPSSLGLGLSAKGKYVASKNGTAYHLPWCAGALKIKEENKIWFETKEDATKAGYKPAGNCEGL